MFFEDTNFINIVYALDIALENHFANMLLNSDLTKVIYSSTDFALKKRSRKENWSSEFIPFMNYKLMSINQGEGRPVWNSSAKLVGMYEPTLKKYVKYTPVKFTYDATVWYHHNLDNLYAMTEGIWDDSSETIIDFTVEVNDFEGNPHDLKLYGVLGYSLDYDPKYDQSDWLKNNKIHTVTLNFSIETLLVKSDVSAWLPETTVFNFAHSKGLDPTEYDTTIEFMDDYTGIR